MRKKMNKFFVALGLSLVLGFLVTAQSVVALRDNTPLRSDNGKGGRCVGAGGARRPEAGAP